ncbi:hypothetical protein [Halovulum sp. GXIMD14793]
MFSGFMDFSSLALVIFILASAAGALGMTRAAVVGFAFTFVATAVSVFADKPAGTNMAGFDGEIDPSSITFASAAELSPEVVFAETED